MNRIITNVLSKENYVTDYDNLLKNFGRHYPQLLYDLPKTIHDDHMDFEESEFIYKNTNIDYIGYYIKNNQFKWVAYSLRLIYFAPQYFDPEKFNWDIFSSNLVTVLPEYFSPRHYNWRKSTSGIITEAPFLY